VTRPSSTRAPLDPATLAALVDALAARTPHCRGGDALAVGVADADNVIVRGYGHVRDDLPRVPDAVTMFEIGSITKVFTSLLLADMAEEGLVGLDDELATYMPADVTVPVKDGRPVRLVDLATHTSGLPGVPRAILGSALDWRRRLDPYAHFTEDDLHRALSSTRLRHAPGSRFAYSNMGAALLGEALARRAGTGYEALVDRRITGPLGMSSTCVSLGDTQLERLAQGHSFRGGRRRPWELGPFAPAGALRSCVADMLLFLQANLSPPETTLGQAIRLTHSPRTTVGRHHQIGLGWLISVQPRSLHLVLWHNGGTGGYRSFAAFVPQARVAVVALGARARSVDGLCLKLIEHLTTRPREDAAREGQRVMR
jgi:CubicO group peptidase (beta-lactamase class C family)